MRKLIYLVKEMWYLMKKERLYALGFVLLVLLIAAFLVYQVTPVAIISFVYAGI